MVIRKMNNADALHVSLLDDKTQNMSRLASKNSGRICQGGQ